MLFQLMMIMNIKSIEHKHLKILVQKYLLFFRRKLFFFKGFGEGTNLVWANNGDYAVREGSFVKIISGNK